MTRGGCSKQSEGQVVAQFERTFPQRLKPNSEQGSYRSGKPLRHPKSTARSTSSASCEAGPLQSKFQLSHYRWANNWRERSAPRLECSCESRRHDSRHRHSARSRWYWRSAPGWPRSASDSQAYAPPKPRLGTGTSHPLRSNRAMGCGHCRPRNCRHQQNSCPHRRGSGHFLRQTPLLHHRRHCRNLRPRLARSPAPYSRTRTGPWRSPSRARRIHHACLS